MPGDAFTPQISGPGAGPSRVVGYKGPQAGQSFANDQELAYQAFSQKFSESWPGASGIAGTRVRNSPEFKAALDNAWRGALAQMQLGPGVEAPPPAPAAPAAGGPAAAALQAFGQPR